MHVFPSIEEASVRFQKSRIYLYYGLQMQHILDYSLLIKIALYIADMHIYVFANAAFFISCKESKVALSVRTTSTLQIRITIKILTALLDEIILSSQTRLLPRQTQQTHSFYKYIYRILNFTYIRMYLFQATYINNI